MEASAPISGSKLYFGDNLDLFLTFPTDCSSLHTDIQTFFPFGSIKDSTSPFIDFIVTPSNSLYTDLAGTKLIVDLKITRSDGADLLSTDNITLCSNAFHSLFSDIEILINGQTINTHGGDYNQYRGYLYNLLNYGTEAKKSELSSQLYFPADTETFTSTNKGFVKRKSFTAGSAVVQLCGKLVDSLCTQTRYLPPQVELHIKLRRTADNFLLVGEKSSGIEYKIVMENVKLAVKRHVVHPEIIKIHSDAIQRGEKYTYPLTTTVIKSFPIQSGSNGQISHTLCSGILPKTLAIGITKLKSYQGDMTDPFWFTDFGLKTCNLLIDGNASLSRGFKIDDNAKSLDVFESLMDCTPTSKLGLGFDRETITKGMYILIFDLAQKSHPSRFVNPRQGNLKLQLEFKSALTEAVNVFTWAFYDSQLKIDRYFAPSNDDILT
jgi:hypothetical protein